MFDIFDRDRSGELDYHEFVNALRPERQVGHPSTVTAFISSFHATGNWGEHTLHAELESQPSRPDGVAE